jgi:hypothetical protein
MDLKLYLHKCHDPEGRKNTCILSLRDHTNKCELDVWVVVDRLGMSAALREVRELFTAGDICGLPQELALAPWENYPPEWR